VSSSINIPQPFETVSTLSGAFDTTSNISGTIGTDIAITQLPQIDLNATMTSTSTLNSDSTLGISQIPEIKLGITELPVMRIELGMKPTRIHFPVNMKFSICAMGKELISFSTCGESMVVIEDYHAHELEECR